MSDELVVYRCTECGHQSLSLGSLHGHAERHRGWHGLQWPWNWGDADALMDYTQVLHVTDYTEYRLDSTDELQQVVPDE